MSIDTLLSTPATGNIVLPTPERTVSAASPRPEVPFGFNATENSGTTSSIIDAIIAREKAVR